MKDLEKILGKVLPSEKPEIIPVIENCEIHDLLTGEYLDERRKVFRKSYQLESEESSFAKRISNFKLPALIAKYSGIQLPDLEDLLFIDTETTGLAGGTGTVAFEIGLGWFKAGSFQVDQLFLTDMDGEVTLLEQLNNYLNRFSTLVSFNGKSFDIPLLSSRFILNRLVDPVKELQNIDLLHLSRRIWKNSLPDCSLGTIERMVLDINRDRTKDIPGSEIPQEYFYYLQTRDASEMVKVMYHNYFDIITMYFLLQKISEILWDTDSIEFLEEIYGLAKLFLDQEEIEKAIPLFQKILKIHPGHQLSIRKLSFIYKKQKNYQEALKLWEKAAKAGEIYALIEIAKYYEHSLKDCQKALFYTREALKAVYNNCYEQDPLLQQLEQRLKRLQTKTADEN